MRQLFNATVLIQLISLRGQNENYFIYAACSAPEWTIEHQIDRKAIWSCFPGRFTAWGYVTREYAPSDEETESDSE